MTGTNGLTRGSDSQLWLITIKRLAWVLRFTAGTTWMSTASGVISPGMDTGGRPMHPWAGRLIQPECGAGIPVGDTRGFRESPGGGCPFITATGISILDWDGFGCLGRLTPGAPLWSTGIPAPDGSAGRRSELGAEPLVPSELRAA